MNEPHSKKVSIVLPVYNGEAHVAQAIESVLQQTYQNLELILVNDCSTDGTAGILERYAALDPRVKVVCNPVNLKLPRTLNAGFDLAEGAYFTWTSDDNRYKKEAIRRMVEHLEASPDIDMVYADFTDIDQNGRELRQVRMGQPEELLSGNQIGACFLYTREIAQKVGFYDPNLFLAEDYDYWLRIWQAGKLKHIPENLYEYRRHAGSLSVTKQNLVGRQTCRTLEKNFLFLYAAAKTRKNRRLLLGQMFLWLGPQDNRELCRKLAVIDRCFIWKKLAKDRLRDTALGNCLRKLKGRLR